MLKRKNQSGFTLLEVALVLIVVSLIVLAVIKAQGIWNEAKSFRLIRQVQELQVAVALYENKIGQLPGDTVPDGEIDNTTFPDEWARDLSDENLILSVAKATTHPFGDDVLLEWIVNTASPFGTDQNLFVLDKVPNDFARALDDALDDGNGILGSVRATEVGAPTVPVAYGSFDIVDVWVRLN